MSESPKKEISMILSDKPKIEPVESSSLFSRLRSFLPQMEEANRNIPTATENNQFMIETVSQSASSSDTSDSEDDDEGNEKEECKEEFKEHIVIDLDVFREQQSKVDNRDVSVQQVDVLPEAFQSAAEETEKAQTSLIEEL